MNGLLGAPLRAIGNVIKVLNGDLMDQKLHDARCPKGKVDEVHDAIFEKDGMKDMIVRMDERINGKKWDGIDRRTNRH
jgi:hypothetical protein